MTAPRVTSPSLEAVEAALHRLWIVDGAASLRREHRKKAIEVTALLGLLGGPGKARELVPGQTAATSRNGRLLVDAATGLGYVGLLAVELLGFRRLVALEREPARAAMLSSLAARWPHASITVRAGDVEDHSLWPEQPDVVAALHACGAAADAILDAAVAARAKWIHVVPCCYGVALPFAPRAFAAADRAGLPDDSAIRSRFVAALVDGERALRLEAAGYETSVVPFVPPTVTPHNLVFRARRVGEPKRMAEAEARLARLRAG